jgi:hypothetical protein
MADHHNVAAQKRGAARSASLREAVKNAQDTILREMQDNGNIYPHSGGNVSLAELARRANVNESTFYKPKNVKLKAEAIQWLENLKSGATIGRKRVRKHFKEAANDWKTRFECIQHNYVINQLKLQSAEAQIIELKSEVASLRSQLLATPSNVKNIASKAKR